MTTHFKSMVAILGAIVLPSLAFAQPGLVYSGKTDWEPSTGTLTFRTSGKMPDTREGFFWQVPPSVRRIVIASNVTVTGGFRVLFRQPDNPLHMAGEHRKTSVIFGTDEQRWTDKNGIDEADKWKYGNLSVIQDAVVYVSTLTSKNPRGYNISGYAKAAVIHVDSCDLLDTRDGDNNNSDGFIGASGSSIRNSLISTSDDGIKIYHDISIENVTIEHHRNGAPLQFGWGGEMETATASISNLTIKGVDQDDRYNMAPLTWEGGEQGVRNVVINGLKVESKGVVYHEDKREWQPLGLLELKPSTCEFNLTVSKAKLGALPLGLRNTRGSVVIRAAPGHETRHEQAK